MEKQRRSFSEEFKRKAVRRVEAHESTFSQIARELGVNRSLLQLWRKRYGTQTSKESPATPIESLAEENRRLRRENANLREDREILKKAAAFFAKESR